MRFFLVSYICDFGDRTDRVDSFHGAMFHGEETPFRVEYRPPDQAGKPLAVSRSGHWLPDVSFPGAFVVREYVRDKLVEVPNIAFRKVKWAKLIDLPYFPPGDYSFNENALFRKTVGVEVQNLERLYKKAPDVPALHKGFPAGHEMLAHARSMVGGAYRLRRQTIDRQPGVGDKVEVELSPEFLRDYPIIFDGGLIFREDVFPLIDPHIDRDFFTVAEGET